MKYPLNRIAIITGFLLIIYNTSFSQCVMTANCAGGNWSSPATWIPSGCGTVNVPGDNMTVIIPACAVVSVDINSPTYNNFGVQVYGEMYFFGGQKINISCAGYFYVAP